MEVGRESCIPDRQTGPGTATGALPHNFHPLLALIFLTFSNQCLVPCKQITNGTFDNVWEPSPLQKSYLSYGRAAKTFAKLGAFSVWEPCGIQQENHKTLNTENIFLQKSLLQLDYYVSEETRFCNWTIESFNSGNFINLLPTDLTSIGNMYGSAHCFGFSYRMKNMFLSTSQPFVSGTPAVCQKFPGPALVPGEEDGKEEEEGEGADEKADEGEELHAEGQTGRQRLCW